MTSYAVSAQNTLQLLLAPLAHASNTFNLSLKRRKISKLLAEGVTVHVLLSISHNRAATNLWQIFVYFFFFSQSLREIYDRFLIHLHAFICVSIYVEQAQQMRYLLLWLCQNHHELLRPDCFVLSYERRWSPSNTDCLIFDVQYDSKDYNGWNESKKQMSDSNIFFKC